MASNRSRKFRSITGRISELDKQVGEISRTAQTVTDGLGNDAVSSDSILSGAVGSEALQVQSITADKIAPSVFQTASSGTQRVPAPLNLVDYWDSAISGNITAFFEAYSFNKENKNITASASGITFSPEKNSQVIIDTAELKSDGLVIIKTRTSHGWEIGDYVTSTNLGSPLDGEWVITDVPTEDTFCYTLDQYEELNTEVVSLAYVDAGGDLDTGTGYTHRIIKKSFIDGVVTLVLVDDIDSSPTSDEHGYQPGYVVTVSGLGSPYDGEHYITAIPDEQTNAIQYRLDTKTIEEFTPRVVLSSGWGNGDFITYETQESSESNPENSLHGLSVNQFVEITGFTTNTGYNRTSKVSGVFGAGRTFSIDADVVPATDAPETGGTYYCYNGEVKAEADAVLFLTGKNPIPVSRNVVISWSSDKPINFYIVVWNSATPDIPSFIPVNSDQTESIFALPGVNNYLWEIPESISHYAVFAEVLSGGDDVLLKECYVFESVGDASKKAEKITNAYVDAVANNTNEITLYTPTTHPYELEDTVLLSGMEVINESLNKTFTVTSVASDKRSFTVSVPTQAVVVSTNTANGNVVFTNPLYDQLTNAVSNVNISGLISVGQPYSSSNTTALPNGTVTQILSSNVFNDVKTGLVATLSSGANTITLTTGNTTSMFVGQQLTKTSGTGVFGNSGVVYVTAISNSTALTVDANHATSGSITFKSSQVSKNYDSFSVSETIGATNSAVTLTFYLPATEANSNVSLTASSIGGVNKPQTTTVNPSGLSIESKYGKTVNLTDGATDNYVTVSNSEFASVASISNTGAGTFKTLDADSLSVDGDITIGNENTALVGTFIDEKFNGRPYGGSLLDRLARGTIYQAYWLTPTPNINTQYHGFAAGTFKLDTNRLYQVYVSSSGMRASVNTNVALEFLISTTPIRVENDLDLSHLSYTHPAQTYTTSTPNNSTYTTGIGNDSVFTTTTNSSHSHLVNVTHTHSVTASHTHTVNVFTSSFWRDLVGHFYSTSPTPVASNTTKYAITSFTRASTNANVVITLPNVAGKYIESYVDTGNMFFGVKMNNRLYDTDTNGTYKLMKINRTEFRFVSSNTTAISSVQRVQNLQATLSTGSNTITLTSGVTTNIANGQMLIKTSGTGEFGNAEVVYVISKTNPSTLVVGYANGAGVNHSVAGAITFEASAGEITLVDPIMTNTSMTFSNANQELLLGTISAGSNTMTGLSSTSDIAVGDTIYRYGGAALSNTTVTSIINSTAITMAATAGASGGVSFDTNKVLATSDGTNHTYLIPNLFQAGQLVDVYSTANSAWDITAGTVVSANSTQFIVTPRSNVVSNGSSFTGLMNANWSDRQVQLHRNYLPSETDLYYVLRLRHQVTPSSYAITLAENPNSMLAVTDLGQAKDMDFVAQGDYAGTTWTSGLPIGYSDEYSTNTTRLTETQVLDASDSAYYDNYGKSVSTNIPFSYLYHLYQGNPGDASGIKKSAVLFPAFDFTDKTDGLVIVKLEVYLRNRHSYNSEGLTAYLAVHEGTSLGSSVPLAKDSCPAITTTFTKGQGKWITLPTSWHSAFSSGGTGRGILLGVTDENPDTYYNAIDNYGYFDGVTLDDAPRIRVTFEYNSVVGSENSVGGDGSDGFYDYLNYRYN